MSTVALPPSWSAGALAAVSAVAAMTTKQMETTAPTIASLVLFISRFSFVLVLASSARSAAARRPASPGDRHLHRGGRRRSGDATSLAHPHPDYRPAPLPTSASLPPFLPGC